VAKAIFHSVGFLRGLKPPTPSVLSSCAGCKVVAFQNTNDRLCGAPLAGPNLQARGLLHGGVPGVVVGALEGDVVFVAGGLAAVEQFLCTRAESMMDWLCFEQILDSGALGSCEGIGGFIVHAIPGLRIETGGTRRRKGERQSRAEPCSEISRG